MFDFINEDHITVRIDRGIDDYPLPAWFSKTIGAMCDYYGLRTTPNPSMNYGQEDFYYDPFWVLQHDAELTEAYLTKIGLEFEKFKLDKLRTTTYSKFNTSVNVVPEGYVFKSNSELTALLLKYGK